MEEWLSISDVVNRTGIPENTVRRYVRNHKMFLKMKKGQRNSYWLHECDLHRIGEIRKLYEDGLSVEEVNEWLKDKGVMTITVKDEDGGDVVLSEVVNQLRESMKKQEEFNKLLLQKLDEQNQYIHEKLEQRDKMLLESMKESMEFRKEVAISEKESAAKRRWWEFWRK